MSAMLPTLVLLGAAVMWGFSWLPLKSINGLGVEGPTLTLIAFGAALLFIAPAMWRQWRVVRRYPSAMASMFILGGVANFAFTIAIIYGDIIRVMMLFYLAPVWGVLGGALFLGERLDGKRLLGVAMAIGGAFLVLGAMQLFRTPPSYVDLLAVAAGFAFAMNNVACRAYQAIPVASKLGAMFLGTVLLSGAYALSSPESLPTLTLNGWAWSIAYGIAWIVVATLATQWAVTHMEAGRAAIILVAELLVAVVSAAMLAGEVMTSMEVAGGLLILAATLLEARRPAVADVSHGHAVDAGLQNENA